MTDFSNHLVELSGFIKAGEMNPEVWKAFKKVVRKYYDNKLKEHYQKREPVNIVSEPEQPVVELPVEQNLDN